MRDIINMHSRKSLYPNPQRGIMIRTELLNKKFTIGKGKPPIHAVQDLTLHVSEGEVFGFLGPNGAGKTTTVRMLTSLIGPTSGEAFIGVCKSASRTDKFGTGRHLTETPGMYERLSAEKNRPSSPTCTMCGRAQTGRNF